MLLSASHQTSLAGCSHRAGADRVTGVEISQHMHQVALETLTRNNLAARCAVINKDVRKLSCGADLPRKADVCIFEVKCLLSSRPCKRTVCNQ